MNQQLFRSDHGAVCTADIRDALLKVGAQDCDVLYVHTGMRFGLPSLKRKELLGQLFEIFENLDIPTLVFPTFTFSFCNSEIYNPATTPTSMGALNEYIRKSGLGKRSMDPLLSVYVLGDDLGLTDNLSEYSIGLGSSYDKLHNCSKNVKFLFFGTDMRECFTYTHYVEALMEVPYRYNRKFSGIICENGVETPSTRWLYSTYSNCILNPVPVVHDTMEKRGLLRKVNIGDGNLTCFSEKDGFKVLEELINADQYALTNGTFDPFVKDFNYNPSNIRVVSVL